MVISLAKQPNDPRRVIQLGTALPEALRNELDDREAYLITGNPAASALEIRAAMSQQLQLSVREILNSYRTPEENAAVDATKLQQLQEKMSDFMNNPDLFYEATIALGEGSVSAIDARMATNGLIARRLNEQADLDEQNGLFDRFVDLAGYAASETFLGPWEKIGSDPVSEQLGREVQRAMATMQPSEFKVWYENDFLARAREKGIGSGNANYLSEMSINALNAGYNPNAFEEAAMSFFGDAVFGVGSLAGSIVRRGSSIAARTARANSQAEMLAKLRSTTATSAVAGSVTPLGRVAAAEGSQAAASRGAAVIKAEAQAGNTAVREASNMGPGELDPTLNAAKPGDTAFSRLYQEGSLLNRIIAQVRRGSAGHVVDPEYIAANKAKILQDNADANIGRPLLRTSEVVPWLTNAWKAVFHIGTPEGTAFSLTKKGKIPKKVQELADELGGEVFVIKPLKGEPEVVIQIEKGIDITPYVDSITDEAMYLKLQNEQRSLLSSIGSALMFPGRALFRNPLMSNRANQTSQLVQSLAEMGEASIGFYQSELTKALKPYTKLSTLEKDRINAVLTVLRDGDSANLRRWFTDSEFTEKYLKISENKMPSEAVLEGYRAAVEVAETAYVIKAVQIYNKMLKLGYKHVVLRPAKTDSFELSAPGKLLSKNTQLKNSDNILNDGVKGKWEDIVRDGADVQVWKLDKPVDVDGVYIEYVVKPSGVSDLDPRSVLGHNAGGPRTNPLAKVFLVLAPEGGRVRAMLSTFTKEEAGIAKRELEAIQGHYKAGTLTDEILEANSTWNPSMTSVTAFEKFIKENRWENFADSPIGIKLKDEDLSSAQVGFDEASEGMKAGDYLVNDQHRLDRVLTHFGGNKTFNQDPLTNLTAQFGSAAHELAYNAYTQVAMHSWVNTVKKTNPEWLPKGVSQHDIRNLFLNAKVVVKDERTAALARIHNVERRRLGIKGPVAQSMELLYENLTDFVFNKSKMFRKNGVHIMPLSPTESLLKIGFHSALGLFNPRQALVQSTHAIAIMAISPKHGMKGAGLSFAMRSLFHADKEALELGLRRAAKKHGYTYEEMVDMFDHVRFSGRKEINADALELGTRVSFGVAGDGTGALEKGAVKSAYDATKRITGKTLELGTTPYKAGDRTSRMTGLWTAVLEWKAANPGRMIDSAGQRWITSRDHALNLHMTNTSRRMLQENQMRVPTQWLSHSLAVFEEIFAGRSLTKMERARLAAIYGPFYGLSGVGLVGVTGEIAEMLGIKEDSAAYTTLKWGFIDGMMDVLLPDGDWGKVGTGLSSSLSPWGQIMELHRKFTEETPIEAIGGPSGAIAANIYNAFFSTLGSIRRGDTALLQEDIIKLLRQPSTIDNLWKGIGIINNGVYASKNGVMFPFEMSPVEGFLQLLGVGSLRGQEYYNLSTQVFRSNKKLAADRQWFTERRNRAYELVRSGDPDMAARGVEILNELAAQIQFSGYSPANQRSLYTTITNPPPDRLGDLLQSLYRMGRTQDLARAQAL